MTRYSGHAPPARLSAVSSDTAPPRVNRSWLMLAALCVSLHAEARTDAPLTLARAEELALEAEPGQLAGVAAEIGVLVLTFIDQELARVQQASGGPLRSQDILVAAQRGTSERVRPIIMTAAAITIGLLPLFWGRGTGSETMQRIAVPMVGGMISVTLLSLVVLPVIYAVVLRLEHRTGKETRTT